MNVSKLGLIEDQTSDLLELYSLENPSRHKVQYLLARHFETFGNVGFGSTMSELLVEVFYNHFTKNSPEYLKTECRFINEFQALDLDKLAEEAFLRAKSVLPDRFYESPQVILLMNGKVTDAKVMGRSRFGINLQNLFAKIYKGGEAYDLDKAKKTFACLVVHEANHIFLRQGGFLIGGKSNWLVEIAFIEGLATFVQPTLMMTWSSDYIQNFSAWLAIVKRAIAAQDDMSRRAVIDAVCARSDLKTYNADAVDSANEVMAKGMLDEEEFVNVLRKLLVERNGPLYYVGLGVWQRVYEEEGIDGVRGVVAGGVSTFAKGLTAKP